MKNLLYIVIGAGFLGIISSSASGFLTTETSSTLDNLYEENFYICLLYTSPSPRDLSTSRMPSSA